MTPTTYSIYTNALYSGRIIELDTPDGPIYGRTMFDPDIPPMPTGNEYDSIPPAVLGMDGNIYGMQLSWDGANYLVELIQWTTTWGGEEPPTSSVVVSASVGAVEPDFYNKAVGYIIPGGDNVQAFFQPYVPGSTILLVLSPNATPNILEDCAIPKIGYEQYEVYVTAMTASGYVISLGGAAT